MMRTRQSERGVVFMLALLVVAVTGLYLTTGMTRTLTLTQTTTQSQRTSQLFQYAEAALDGGLKDLHNSTYDNIAPGSAAVNLQVAPNTSSPTVLFFPGSMIALTTAQRLSASPGTLWQLTSTSVYNLFLPGARAVSVQAVIDRPDRNASLPPGFPAPVYATNKIDLDFTEVFGKIQSAGIIIIGRYSKVHGDVISTATQTDGGANLTPTITSQWGYSNVWGDIKTNAVFPTTMDLDYLHVNLRKDDPVLPDPSSVAGANLYIGPGGNVGSAIYIHSASRVDCNAVNGCVGYMSPRSTTNTPATPPITPTDIPADAVAGNTNSCSGLTDLTVPTGVTWTLGVNAPAISYCNVTLNESSTLVVPTGATLDAHGTITENFYTTLQANAGSTVKTYSIYTSRADVNAAPGSTIAIRDWEIHGGSNLTLPGGHYQFDHFLSDPGASAAISLTFSGPTELYTRTLFEHGGHTTIQTTSNNAFDLTVKLVTDPVNGGAQYVTHGQNQTLVGSIYGPDSTITMATGTNIYGAIVGKDVTISNGGDIFIQGQSYIPGPIVQKMWRKCNQPGCNPN